MQSSYSSVTSGRTSDVAPAAKTSMDFDKLHFLTAEQIKFLELRVEYALHNLTPIEQSDSLEAVGIAKYFNGDYQAAIYYLEACVSGSYISLKDSRRCSYIYLLVSKIQNLRLSIGMSLSTTCVCACCGSWVYSTFAWATSCAAKGSCSSPLMRAKGVEIRS